MRVVNKGCGFIRTMLRDIYKMPVATEKTLIRRPVKDKSSQLAAWLIFPSS